MGTFWLLIFRRSTYIWALVQAKLIARERRREPLKPDPPQSFAETTLGQGGERQVNSPAVIGAALGGCRYQRDWFDFSRELWFRHEAKRGNLVPAPQLEQLPSNLRLRVHSVGSGQPFNTGH